MVNIMRKQQIAIDGETLTIDDVVSVARNKVKVILSAKAQAKVQTAAEFVKKWIELLESL